MKIKKLIITFGVAALFMLTTVPGYTESTGAVEQLQEQSFFKKKYKIKGSWSLVERDGKNFITFSKKFKTKGGPDLKVFLSPHASADATGKNALDGSINLGSLKSNKGEQEYEIPAGTDLSQFSSVLVHCEAYAILWGGGSL